MGALTPKIEEARKYIPIDTYWDIHNKLPSLTLEQTRHITALLSEALSNAIRHARTEKIQISLSYLDNLIKLEIRDFGFGISSSAEQGYGLKNMRDRARLLGANLVIESENAKGTAVKLDMFVEDNVEQH